MTLLAVTNGVANILGPLLPLLFIAGLFKLAAGALKEKAKRKARSATKRTRSASSLAMRKSPKLEQSPEVYSAPAVTTLDNLGWENFELLTGELFSRQGYNVQITSGLGADGGSDLTLRRDGETQLVQCKNFAAGNKVPSSAMRDFYGLIVSEGAIGGMFVTTGSFSRDAREFAHGKPITLLERADVERLMVSVTAPGENLLNVSGWINRFAAKATVTNPACQRCRQPMKLRRGPTGAAFWGCTRFPRCKATRDARALLLRELPST